ncbi:hypothetical protein L829_3396 [Mycobacteroides abscessus MAB_030201_1075]|uniref:Uncharacterized protein n=1 Tax=Mycobacteroides abscessus MAB_030201_1075 TaxID=1335410 RepID=A0A829PRS9_9MYCO|nr:hypothetical protein L829_3396 [Mycobacteroides abscessus MAB_030201_1075]
MSVAEGDYNNAIAANTNVVGRTALRQAAEVANDAANTPGWPLSWPPPCMRGRATRTSSWS